MGGGGRQVTVVLAPVELVDGWSAELHVAFHARVLVRDDVRVVDVPEGERGGLIGVGEVWREGF